MKIAVIINNSAGSAYNRYNTERIKKAFRVNKADAKIFEIPGEQIKEQIKSAVYSGFDVVAAAGGDGTINTAINSVADTDVPFGIIPLGTLNHFAKDAGIPLNIEEAVSVILSNNIMRSDIAEVNGHYFVNNSSIGLYPKIVKQRDKEMEKLGYGKWYAMSRAFINIFKRYPVLRLRVIVGDKQSEIKTPFIFIGNNEYSFDFFNLGIRQKLDQGFMSMYFPKTGGRFSMFRFALLALINKLDQEKDFNNSTAEEVQIYSSKQQLDVSADGEVLHLKIPLVYKIHPLKLKLLVPVKR